MQTPDLPNSRNAALLALRKTLLIRGGTPVQEHYAFGHNSFYLGELINTLFDRAAYLAKWLREESHNVHKYLELGFTKWLEEYRPDGDFDFTTLDEDMFEEAFAEVLQIVFTKEDPRGIAQGLSDLITYLNMSVTRVYHRLSDPPHKHPVDLKIGLGVTVSSHIIGPRLVLPVKDQVSKGADGSVVYNDVPFEAAKNVYHSLELIALADRRALLLKYLHPVRLEHLVESEMGNDTSLYTLTLGHMKDTYTRYAFARTGALTPENFEEFEVLKEHELPKTLVAKK